MIFCLEPDAAEYYPKSKHTLADMKETKNKNVLLGRNEELYVWKLFLWKPDAFSVRQQYEILYATPQFLVSTTKLSGEFKYKLFYHTPHKNELKLCQHF